MYTDALDHEVEALSNEVTRLRHMLYRVTELMQPPVELVPAPLSGQPTSSRAFSRLGDSLFHPTPSFDGLAKTNLNSMHVLQSLIEDCAVNILNAHRVICQESSLSSKAKMGRLVKSEYQTHKKRKPQETHVHHRRRGRWRLPLISDDSSDISYSSSASLMPRPRCCFDRSVQTSQITEGIVDYKRQTSPAGMTEILGTDTTPSKIGIPEVTAVQFDSSSSPAYARVELPAQASPESPCDPMIKRGTEEQRSAANLERSTQSNPITKNETVPRHNVDVKVNTINYVKPVAASPSRESQMLSEHLKEIASEMVDQSIEFFHPRSPPPSAQQPLPQESSKQPVEAKFVSTSSALQDLRPILQANRNTVIHSSTDQSSSEESSNALRAAFGVRPEQMEQRAQLPGDSTMFGTTNLAGVSGMQLRPSILEFIRREEQRGSSSLSELTEKRAFFEESRPQSEEVAQPVVHSTFAGVHEDVASSSEHSKSSYVELRSNQAVGLGFADVQASRHTSLGLNSLLSDYDYGFDLGNESVQLGSPVLPSSSNVKANLGCKRDS